MSVQALSWVFDYSESELGARHVLLSIANHAKADGTGAWPSIRRICSEARLSETTVHRAIKELVAMGELAISPNAGPHGTNLYSLPKMQGCQIDTPLQIGAGGVPNCLPGVVKMAPEPSLESTVLIQPSLEDIFYKSISEYEKTLPGLNVAAEFDKIKSWMLANPTRKKKNLRRFVTNWLIRSHNQLLSAHVHGTAMALAKETQRRVDANVGSRK